MSELIKAVASAASSTASTILGRSNRVQVTEEAQEKKDQPKKDSHKKKKKSAEKLVTLPSLPWPLNFETPPILDRTERASWGNQTEFLMSCIATSVGLGNVWRFPFVAYQNGGGAFLIPYIIVLTVIGKPMYYIETVLGQFSSKNTIHVWELSKAMEGTGYATCLGCFYIVSYYVSIIGLCIFYLANSFKSTLPWTVCDPDWGPGVQCVSSSTRDFTAVNVSANATSSAELYFIRNVIKESAGLEYGLGMPIWYLTLTLFIAWFIIFMITIQGVKSSGKASYFLAIFPYIVMITLLISTSLLDGAVNGIKFFITPQWQKIATLDVWYAAVTQVFFSLSVSTAPIIMFASYNDFRQNVYRDSLIVTTLDTVTSLISGFTIFAILGNLAFTLNQNIEDVIGSAGTGLAFVSYPDAVAKTPLPQVFSVLFFLMMTVLGIGSAVAFLSALTTALIDNFPRMRTVYLAGICCGFGFIIDLVYVTPGGQYVLELVDYYGGTFLILFCAICQVIGIFWIYGLDTVCTDIHFMLGRTPSVYWRVCWAIICPFIMIVVFLYALFSSGVLMYGSHYVYPLAGYAAGLCMLFLGISIVPWFIGIAIYRNHHDTHETLRPTIIRAFSPTSEWGPRNNELKADWKIYRQRILENRKKIPMNKYKHLCWVLFGKYKKYDDEIEVPQLPEHLQKRPARRTYVN